MSADEKKAARERDKEERARSDQIAFHLFTKLVNVVVDARIGLGAKEGTKVDAWFNLTTPLHLMLSTIFPKEQKDLYRSVSAAAASSEGVSPLEINILLSVPDLSSKQVLVYTPPSPPLLPSNAKQHRVRLTPTPPFVLLERWVLSMSTESATSIGSVELSSIYKVAIPLFRSLFALLHVLPSSKLRSKKPFTLHLTINHTPPNTLLFTSPLSSSISNAANIVLPTAKFAFVPIVHPAGLMSLAVEYVTQPTFRVDELEAVLSSRFLNDDFVPTLAAVGKGNSGSVAERFLISSSSNSHSNSPFPTQSNPPFPSNYTPNPPAGSTSPPRLRTASLTSSSRPSSLSGGAAGIFKSNPLSSSPSARGSPLSSVGIPSLSQLPGGSPLSRPVESGSGSGASPFARPGGSPLPRPPPLPLVGSRLNAGADPSPPNLNSQRPTPPQQRKRYSSSFGHRYSISRGSSDGSGSGLGISFGSQNQPGLGGFGKELEDKAREEDERDTLAFVEEIDRRRSLQGSRVQRSPKEREGKSTPEKPREEMLTDEGAVDRRLEEMNDVFWESLKHLGR